MSRVAERNTRKTVLFAAIAAAATALSASAWSATAPAKPAATPVKPAATTVKPAAAPAGPTLAQRNAAAAAASKSGLCTSVAPFYWEIGDKNGAISSGTGGTGKVAPPKATTVMPIASASKWLFGAYVVEKLQGVLSTYDVTHLNFTSGYSNFNACSLGSTVSSCLSEAGTAGGTNGEYMAATAGKFYYNGGHMQTLADYMGMGNDNRVALATAMKAVLGTDLPLSYDQPQLAGGANLSPAGYALFLRKILSGKYPHMQKMLGADAVCAHTNTPGCSALYSPANQSAPGAPNYVSNQAYHYSLGHWVEDDPTHGDGAYSSMGKAGFYPWIDKTKTYYGVLAPNDPSALPEGFRATGTPLYCGQAIRRAWISGSVNNLNVR